MYFNLDLESLYYQTIENGRSSTVAIIHNDDLEVLEIAEGRDNLRIPGLKGTCQITKAQLSRIRAHGK